MGKRVKMPFFKPLNQAQKSPKTINNLSHGIVMSKIFAGDADRNFFVF
jgi:hypothetical protein